MKICLSCEGVSNTAASRCGHCGAFLLATDCVHYPDRRGEADAGNPLLGAVIDGKYRLQGVLGRGGLGTVFQAVHIGSLMPVAVKLLHPRFSERSEYRRALIPEARRAATVTNEHCCRMLDVGEAEDGVAYLAMELVEGETLDVLVRSGALAPSHALLVLMQVAEALVAIHAAGLVQCDLSPRNVMVSVRDGRLHVKVLDFGIARTATMGGERARPGEFAGFVNPAFAAPEHLSGQDVDARADLYSFGMLAWLLLCGTPPIDDAEPARAARAIVAGELAAWPNVPGVPRRLQRLILSCLRRDRQARPASAEAVLHELNVVYALRRPALGGASVLALAAAAMAAIVASLDTTPPFLTSVTGSDLVLFDPLLPAASVVQHLRSDKLATLQLHFGAFPAERLRIDVSRGGTVLVSKPLQPVVSAAGETLTLSIAQAEWRSVVESLLSSSAENPVDLSFVVPGSAPLRSARVRLDDEAPRVLWSVSEVDVLTGNSTVTWKAEDAIGLTGVRLLVAWGEHRAQEFLLDGSSGTFPLGRRLAENATLGSDDLGAGTVSLVADDQAGNHNPLEPRPFAHSDIRAPEVIEVTGPQGEPYVPCVGGSARLRVRLSAAEAGCVLRLEGADGREYANVPLGDKGLSHLLEVPHEDGSKPIATGAVTFSVVDPFGNRTSRPFTLTLRDRNPRVEFVGEGAELRTIGNEIVVAATGARAAFVCSEAYRLVRAAVVLAAGSLPRGTTEPVRSEVAADRTTRFVFGAMPPGSHRLEIELEEVGDGGGLHVPQTLALRVLPAVIEVSVPSSSSRFLPALLAAGVLGQSANGRGLRDGPRWGIDQDLLPYLRGTMWVGADELIPVTLPERPSDSLLPDFLPTPGHNVLAVELRDVLDRPVRVIVGLGQAVRRDHHGRKLDVVADFWWHEGPPELVGEELLVEHGQPARLRLRMPLPYRPEELAELRISLAQGEFVAKEVAADGPAGSIVTFVVPFETWRVAAGLFDRTREEFAAAIESQLRVDVATPIRRFDLELRLTTTRSTLRPIGLLELGNVPAALAGIRLVPVLAPEAPFVEPVPDNAPPRDLFRAQAAVVVSNIGDLLLQDRELCCGEVRALVAAAEPVWRSMPSGRLVHADDPLGAGRLDAGALLPARIASAPADQPLCGVDFFQAYTLCRLLGLVVAGDPELFRLPFGCELELAAFSAVPAAGIERVAACNGPAAAQRPVAMAAFVAAAERLVRGVLPTAEDDRRAGDVVAGAFDAEITGLDFGVREWVADLPHVEGEGVILGEWIGNHTTHLQRTADFANGVSPPGDLGVPLRTFGIVRGLALGELDGLLGESGQRLDPASFTVVPASVPGVLRTEQLRRDGRDLLSNGPERRLSLIGFRVAGSASLLARLRGQR